MKKITLMLIALSFASIAQARPDATKLTCAQALDLIDDSGAVVMTYKHSTRGAGPLYARFVRNSFFCGSDEYAKRKAINTIDNDRCYGLVCAQRDND